MKGTFDLEFERGEYGPATAAVRIILAEWAVIDWFEPAREEARVADCHFADHNSLAHAHSPELFAETVDVEFMSGGPAEFVRLCKRVRSPQSSWDWKYEGLKKLSGAHSKARAWKLEDQVRDQKPGYPRPGDLFIRLSDVHVAWGVSGPKLDLAGMSKDAAEAIGFYLSYANMDLCECLEWQLADGSADLAGNPFVPLMRCYAAGYYPFSIARRSVLMFSFTGTERPLPQARLLPPRRN